VQELFSDALRLAMGEAAERILLTVMSDRVMRTTCSEYGLTYDPWFTAYQGMTPVNLGREAAIQDVDLKQLRVLGRLLSSDDATQVILVARVGQTVGPDRPIAYLPSAAVNPASVAQVRRCFRLGAAAVEDTAYVEALDLVSGQALNALQNGRLAEFKGALSALMEPLRVALDIFQSYDIGANQASTISPFALELRPLQQPFSEYSRIMEAAARTKDAQIAMAAAYWPISVMRLEVGLAGSTFFAQATSQIPLLYTYSQWADSPRVADLLRDRAWRQLKEFGFFYITVRLREATDESTLRILVRQAMDIHSSYTELLWMMMDRADVSAFTEAARGYWQTVELDFLANGLDIGLDPALVPEQTPNGDITRVRATELRGFALRRDALWMALGGWLCSRRASGQAVGNETVQIYSVIVRPLQNFGRIWRTYLSTEAEDLPIRRWEAFDRPEGRGYMVQSDAFLALFFALAALRVVPQTVTPDRLRRWGVTDDARTLRRRVGEALDRIAADPERWVDFGLPPDWEERSAWLRSVLDTAEADQERREQERIFEQPLSTEKVSAFQNESLSAWRTASYVREAFARAGRVRYSTDQPPPNANYTGIDTLTDKSAFVDGARYTRKLWTGSMKQAAYPSG